MWVKSIGTRYRYPWKQVDLKQASLFDGIMKYRLLQYMTTLFSPCSSDIMYKTHFDSSVWGHESNKLHCVVSMISDEQYEINSVIWIFQVGNYHRYILEYLWFCHWDETLYIFYKQNCFKILFHWYRFSTQVSTLFDHIPVHFSPSCCYLSCTVLHVRWS